MNVARPTRDDAAELLAVAEAADHAVYGDTDWTAAELETHLGEIDLECDAWLVRLDGRVAGWASLEPRGGGRLLADGYVDPALHGRGVGAKLLELTEARARERAEELDGAVVLQNATLNQDAAARALYEGRGYVAARWFWRMVKHLDEEPPAPVVPEGLRIESFEPEFARDVHAALNEAFADDWDHHPEPFEEWERRRLKSDRFRPDLWLTAWDGADVAGVLHGDSGWIGSLGVRGAWRGRGLGLALLQTSFRRFWELGERTVALGVDADNPTGATRLYERAGMHRLWEAVLWQKQLR